MDLEQEMMQVSFIFVWTFWCLVCFLVLFYMLVPFTVQVSNLALCLVLCLFLFLPFLLCLSISSSLVSLWTLGTEHSWALTLAKGDPLRRRSMLVSRIIQRHNNIPLSTFPDFLNWLKVFYICMVAFSWKPVSSLAHSIFRRALHPIRRLLSAWERVTDLWNVFLASYHIMVTFAPSIWTWY